MRDGARGRAVGERPTKTYTIEHGGRVKEYGGDEDDNQADVDCP